MEAVEAIKEEDNNSAEKEPEILDYFKFSVKIRELYLNKFKKEKQKNAAAAELDRVEQQINKELDKFKKERGGQANQEEIGEFLYNFLEKHYRGSDIYEEIFMGKQAKEPVKPKLKLAKTIELPLENFREKYGKFVGKNLFEDGDTNKNWIYLKDGYNPETGEVSIFDGAYKKGEKSRRIKLDELDNFLEKYKFAEAEKETEKKPELRKMEEAEKEAEILEMRDAENNKPEEEIIELTDVIEEGSEAREKELEQLKQEVEKARKEYLGVDYKKNKAYHRIYKFLGGVFKNKEERILENDQDIAWYRAHYDDALFNYKNAVLEDAKNRKVSNKELGGVLKFFETEAKVSVADDHEQVKAENQDYKLAKFFTGKMSEVIQNYRKLPLVKKAVIAAAFGFGTLATGATGSALVIGTAASAATIRRIFMGMVAGTGAALVAEKITQKNREKSARKEVSGFEKEAEHLSEEDIYKMLEGKIDDLVYDEDQKINTIKNKNIRNLAIGVGTGFASAVLVPEFVKHGKEWFSHLGAGNKVIEHFTAHKVAGVPGYENINPLEHSNLPNQPVASQMPPAPEVAKDIDLSVHKGGSFEGSVIKHLESTGVKHEEAGEMAHRMWAEYVRNHPDAATKNYSLIHPNAQIELSPDGKQIVGFQDSPKSAWGGETKVSAEIEPAEQASGKIPGNVNEDSSTFGSKGVNIEERLSEIKSASPPLENPDGIPNEETMAKVAMAGIGGAIIGKKIAGSKTESVKDAAKALTEKKITEKKYKTISKKYGFNEEDDLASKVYKVARGGITLKTEDWHGLKDKKMEDIKGKKSPFKKELAKNIKKLEKEWTSLLGDKANPESGETVKEWLIRVVREADKKEKI